MLPKGSRTKKFTEDTADNMVREAAKIVLFLVAWPLRGGRWVRALPNRKNNFFKALFKLL